MENHVCHSNGNAKRNKVLKKEKTYSIDEGLRGKKTEVMEIKNMDQISSSSDICPLKRLEAMKIAFEKNEAVITEQKELIKYYEKYCCGLRKIVKAKKISTAGLEQCKLAEAERDFSCKENEKLKSTIEGMSNEIVYLKEDNGLLKDTVSSLTFLIEKLLQQNEKLSYGKNSEASASSSLTSVTFGVKPRSDFVPAESLKSSFVFDKGSGDNANDSALLATLDKSTFPLDYSAQNKFQSNSETLLSDLSRMAKSAETLGRTAHEIISETLGHMHYNPQ